MVDGRASVSDFLEVQQLMLLFLNLNHSVSVACFYIYTIVNLPSPPSLPHLDPTVFTVRDAKQTHPVSVFCLRVTFWFSDYRPFCFMISGYTACFQIPSISLLRFFHFNSFYRPEEVKQFQWFKIADMTQLPYRVSIDRLGLEGFSHVKSNEQRFKSHMIQPNLRNVCMYLQRKPAKIHY